MNVKLTKRKAWELISRIHPRLNIKQEATPPDVAIFTAYTGPEGGMAMIPQTGDDLRQDFEFETLPSRTFRLNHNTLTIIGTIDEIEAVEQAVYLILNTERYQWLIHSWDYGVELHNLIGKDVEYCIPEIERRIREALLQDDRITAVENFEFTVNKKQVLTTFTVVSIFGEINTEMGVEI